MRSTHEMRPIATEVAWSVCVCVCVGHERESCKTAEPIEVVWGVQSGGQKST